MQFGIKTLDDYQLEGKTVLTRVDINQPIDHATGTLKDTTRVEACVPTIRELSDKGAKVVLMAHQGSDIEYQNFYTTKPHSEVLEKLLGRPVKFIDDVCGPAAREMIKNLKNGEIMLLDNVRYIAEEQTLFELDLKLTHEQQAKTLVVQKLAPLADLYVGDAFAAAHRDQPSLCGFQQVLPSAMGRLFEEEFTVLSNLMENPERPSVYVLGGAKIADAFLMMDSVLSKGNADNILTGGLVGNVLLWAAGKNISKASTDFLTLKGFDKLVPNAKELIEKYGEKILLPTDVAYVKDGVRYDTTLEDLPNDQSAIDIGPETAKLYQEKIRGAKHIFVNGPMGIFEEEPSEFGTKAVWDALGDTKGYSVIGGGDSITATNKYGKKDAIDYICTAGGALIRFMTGEELPVVKALRHGSKVDAPIR